MKKILLLVLSLVLVGTLALGGTIAYLTDTEEDTNVMVVGNVDINQLEYERVVKDGKWVDVAVDPANNYGYNVADELKLFEQGKKIIPMIGTPNWDTRTGTNTDTTVAHQQVWSQVGAPGSNQLFDASVKNVHDKFVFVKNIGNENAYFRTWIAIEAPEGSEVTVNGTEYPAVMASINGHKNFIWTRNLDTVEVDGVRYYLLVATHTEMLAPGETSRPSLLQLYMRSEVTSAQAKLFGKELNVLVFSQAVQADSWDAEIDSASDKVIKTSAEVALDTAFGELVAENHPWSDTEAPAVDNWSTAADTSWYNDTDTEFELDSAEDLAGLAELVNGGNTFKGKTVKLTASIDLGGKEWTPIGNASTAFQGTFDGDNFSVNDLFINTPASSNVGLFGMTTNGEIKNLIVNNVSVKGDLNVGAVAGTPYTSKYTNITVKGLIQIDGMSYVGGVGGKNAYANWTDILVDAAKGSYVKANSVEYSEKYGEIVAFRTYVGGVVGFMGEGGHTMKNVTSNIDVYGSTCDVGGIVGIAHYGNKFENVTCKGNVTITHADELASAQQIGGIAGVWYNQDGQTVTFTNCKFTGKLSTTGYDIVIPSCGNLVCASYKATGTGKLIIDGKEYGPVGVVSTDDALKNVLAKAKAGDTVILAGGEYAPIDGTIPEGVTIVGNDGAAIVNDSGNAFSKHLTDVTFVNVTFDGSNALRYCYAYGVVTFRDCTFTGGTYGVHFDAGSGSLVFENCYFEGWNSFGRTLSSVSLDGCTFAKGNSGYANVRFYQNATINNCIFEDDFNWIDVATSDVTLQFSGCTYNGTDVAFDKLVCLNGDFANVKCVVDGVEYDVSDNDHHYAP